MASQIVLDCCKLLAEKKMSIAFAESATAGRMAAEFALSPESGNFLMGGLVCYDAGLKQDILKVPTELIKKYTPESPEVTAELANRLPGLIKSDISVGITGLTTPGGSETPEKPVGTMFIRINLKGKAIAARELFKGSPEEIILQAVDKTASLILQELG